MNKALRCLRNLPSVIKANMFKNKRQSSDDNDISQAPLDTSSSSCTSISSNNEELIDYCTTPVSSIEENVIELDTLSCTSSSSSDEHSVCIMKKLPKRSWIQNKLWHKMCLEHDRYWAEDLRERKKAHPITLQMYDTINQLFGNITSSSSEEDGVNVIEDDNTLDTIEETSDTSSTSSSSVEEYPKVSFMIRLLSVKIIDVTFSLSRTIDDVRNEIRAQFGLVPSQYILKAGCKTLSNSNCSLLDYNITSNQTLDIELRANQCLRGGTDTNNDDPLYEKEVPELVNILKQKGVPRGSKPWTQSNLIKRYREAETNGWKKKRPKSSQKRTAESRANRSHNKKKEDNAKDAKRHTQVRADEKNASVHNWPRTDTLLGETPGKDYKVQYHTEDVMAALYLFHLESGGWIYRESMWLIAYLHVMKRLAEADDSCISKLNGLLELSIERYSTLYKTLYQEVLDDNDLKQVCKWKGQTEHRQLMDRKEAVLEWFATDDSCSFDDRKAKLRPLEEIDIEKRQMLLESLVGLHLKVPNYWWPGERGEKKWTCVIESINLDDDKERYFNLKCLGDPYPDKRYEMAYVDVKKYADREHTEFSDFYLPKTLDECVDLEFKARCDKTLQELRR